VKTVNKIKKLYSQGLSCNQISRIIGRSPTYIYNLLNSNNIKLRTKSQANKIFPDFLLINLYNIGLSTPQIGRLLGIHRTTIVKRFNKISFPLRNKSLAKSIGYSEKEFSLFFNNEKIKVLIEGVLDGVS